MRLRTPDHVTGLLVMGVAAICAGATTAFAQEVPPAIPRASTTPPATPTPSTTPTTTPRPGRLHLVGPGLRATGVGFTVRASTATPRTRVSIEQLGHDGGWHRVGAARVDGHGKAKVAIDGDPRASRFRLRATSHDHLPSRAITVRTRDVTLDAFGDANVGDGVADAMDRLGTTYPWGGVAPTLKAADIAFGNLECSISTRGTALVKEFTFRGSPTRLAEIVRYAGLDVLNLANNHVGDYGPAALADTIANVRSTGALAVGAGYDSADAARPRVVTRLGLKVAFVGFSDINPAGFGAGSSTPGTQFATPEAIASSVKAAKRRADAVVATFHWGIERDPHENDRQRAFANEALAAGASAVIGAHPHVLQPIRSAGPHRVVAYSLGNFVWSAGSPSSASTGILHLGLSTRGVEDHHLQRATIVDSRPRLDG
jgi:hypothetical protein